MTQLKITAKTHATWLGRRAEVWEAREAGAAGVRYQFQRWVDDADPKNGGHAAGTVTRRKIKGTRTRTRDTLVVLEERRVVTGAEIFE